MSTRLARLRAALIAAPLIAAASLSAWTPPASASTHTAVDAATSFASNGMPLQSTNGATDVQMVHDLDFYLRPQIEAGYLLHVDESTAASHHLGPAGTAEASKAGFYYAIKQTGCGSGTPRCLTWVFQPYGAYCSDFTGNPTPVGLAWNPWLNTVSCDDNYSTPASGSRENLDRNAYCHQTQGQPWADGQEGSMVGRVNPNGSPSDPNRILSTTCTSGFLSNESGGAYIQGSQDQWIQIPSDVATGTTLPLGTWRGPCAPWESQDVQGACGVHYGWETSGDWSSQTSLLFHPQPDSCTGRVVHPGSFTYVTSASGVPGCQGADNAPNCTSATSWSPACGGALEVPPLQTLTDGGAPSGAGTGISTGNFIHPTDATTAWNGSGAGSDPDYTGASHLLSITQPTAPTLAWASAVAAVNPSGSYTQTLTSTKSATAVASQTFTTAAMSQAVSKVHTNCTTVTKKVRIKHPTKRQRKAHKIYRLLRVPSCTPSTVTGTAVGQPGVVTWSKNVSASSTMSTQVTLTGGYYTASDSCWGSTFASAYSCAIGNAKNDAVTAGSNDTWSGNNAVTSAADAAALASGQANLDASAAVDAQNKANAAAASTGPGLIESSLDKAKADAAAAASLATAVAQWLATH